MIRQNHAKKKLFSSTHIYIYIYTGMYRSMWIKANLLACCFPFCCLSFRFFYTLIFFFTLFFIPENTYLGHSRYLLKENGIQGCRVIKVWHTLVMLLLYYDNVVSRFTSRTLGPILNQYQLTYLYFLKKQKCANPC